LRSGRVRIGPANPDGTETAVIVVSNTSPLTNLAAVGRIDILRQLYSRIIIAEAVHRELTADNGTWPGAIVNSLDWIEARPINNPLLVTALRTELDEGEAETIVLAQELTAKLVIMDERRGRLTAGRFGLPVIGLLGALIEARRRDLIPEIKPSLDDLRHSGFWIRQDLYDSVLKVAGE
ncbi:MAG: DUF3368 domain-containing protein, partial [Blastocatellia bacterium]